jgi:hypothetical protein
VKTWKIFIHCHNVIWDEMYENDPDFTMEHYRFLKLGRHDLQYNASKGYRIIRELDFPIYWDATHYAELTGMYCVYKNRLHDGLDYIGFSHYDKEHRLLYAGGSLNIKELEAARAKYDANPRKCHEPTDITSRIQKLVESPLPVHVSLESHDFQKIYNQRVLMDDTQPDAFVGEGVNCIDRILEDYNSFFQTKYTLQDVSRDGFLTMCDCFITPISIFDKLMSFITHMMESGKLDRYDTQRLHRLQGGLLERYVAVFFALENVAKVDLSTVHQVSKKLKKPKKWRFYEFCNRKTD